MTLLSYLGSPRPRLSLTLSQSGRRPMQTKQSTANGIPKCKGSRLTNKKNKQRRHLWPSICTTPEEGTEGISGTEKLFKFNKKCAPKQ